MNGWGIFAIAALTVPSTVIISWFSHEQLSARTRKKFLERNAERSVDGIRERVEREREDERISSEDTQFIAAVQLIVAPAETVKPRRVRPYANYPPSPHPPLERPGEDSMQRILDGLHRLN
jgi:hypothetical protein